MLTTDHRVINWQHLTPDCYLRPLGVQKVGPIFPAGLCNDNDVFAGVVVTLGGVSPVSVIITWYQMILRREGEKPLSFLLIPGVAISHIEFPHTVPYNPAIQKTAQL